MQREGIFAGFTERYGVKRRVWYDMTGAMAEAIASEKRLKRWRRDWKIEVIERDNPLWSDPGPAIGLPALHL